MGVLATSKGDELILWVFLAWTVILDSWIIFCWFDSLQCSRYSFFFFLIYLAMPGLSCSMQGF